jgi:hypothetical protein
MIIANEPRMCSCPSFKQKQHHQQQQASKNLNHYCIPFLSDLSEQGAGLFM